jgi:hypothetical protein
MTNNTPLTPASLEPCIQSLFLELLEFKNKMLLTGSLKHGTTAIGKQVLAAWINFLPHNDPDEEVLIVQLEITPLAGDGSGHLLALFAGWSSGQVMKDYITGMVIDQDPGKPLLEAVRAAVNANKQRLVADVEVEMLKKGSPAYTNN